VITLDTGQVELVKATLAELHRDTAKLVRPVIDGQKTLVITHGGKARAKIVPLPKKPDRKRALAILRSMAGLELPSRK
jgi:antitoxin (DNA-binding transcriptional repressor) of toxin-antitoxin stability system